MIIKFVIIYFYNSLYKIKINIIVLIIYSFVLLIIYINMYLNEHISMILFFFKKKKNLKKNKYNIIGLCHDKINSYLI